MSGRGVRCPACRSRETERAPLAGETAEYYCRDCGCSFSKSDVIPA